MLTTKKYEYLDITRIQFHPDIVNHRQLDQRKVSHYSQDILKNGLLEPLVVWERKHNEYFLVGGFHRLAAIGEIRSKNPGYFDRVDVRVVSGDIDEIRALNLKLNADRVDTKITDFFDIIIYLNNANWSKEKIAEFIDRSYSFIDDIIRYVPSMDNRIREFLRDDKITWTRAKAICKAVMDAEPGMERAVLQGLIAEILEGKSVAKQKKPLTFRDAKKKFMLLIKEDKKTRYTVDHHTILSLLLVIEGKNYEDAHIERVRESFPGLID